MCNEYLLDFVRENMGSATYDKDYGRDFDFLFDDEYMVGVLVNCIIDVFDEYEGSGKFSGGIWSGFVYGGNKVPLEIEIYEDSGWVCCFGYAKNPDGGLEFDDLDFDVSVSFQWVDIKSYIRDKKISELGL